MSDTNFAARSFMQAALAGKFDRRELFQRGAALGFSAIVLGALAQPSFGNHVLAAEEGKLKGSFYSWIPQLHPAIDAINSDFGKTFPFSAEIAPVESASADVFIAEAKGKTSTWDIYVGQTPFSEMIGMIDSGTSEPWDPYMPADVKADILPSVLAEGTVDGKLYNWPIFLDIIVQAWNARLVEKAGLDPTVAPTTWDEFIASAKKVKDSGAAPFGATFDRGGWRSLAPVAHSISLDVYTPDGFFDFTNDAVVQALEILKQIKELANPDIMTSGTSNGGQNGTGDEGAWASEQVAYYVKYQNAPLRFSGNWEDPTKVMLAGLPKTPNGAGGTVFWSTGAALLKYGANKQQAANYMKALTYDERLWKESLHGSNGEAPVGQTPCYQSLYTKYQTDKPDWVSPWVFLIHDQLARSSAIHNNKYGFTQFFSIGDQYWHQYLTGEVTDPRKALQNARDAVIAEVKKSSVATPTS
jgi:multiple sugar transport system substrate-binding protein